MAKQKNLSEKRTCWYKAGRADLWWGYFVLGVTPKEFWKKKFRLEEASFFDLVSHLRPYISPNPNSPNRRDKEHIWYIYIDIRDKEQQKQLKKCFKAPGWNQCTKVRPSLSASVGLCTCCTFSIYPKTN